jgi:hypothetical protein
MRAGDSIDLARTGRGSPGAGHDLCADRRDDTVEQRLDKLEAVLDDLVNVVPLLADLLSIPTGERYPPLNLSPQKRKERTLHAQLAQVPWGSAFAATNEGGVA